jgi:hypothetical protein
VRVADRAQDTQHRPRPNEAPVAVRWRSRRRAGRTPRRSAAARPTADSVSYRSGVIPWSSPRTSSAAMAHGRHMSRAGIEPATRCLKRGPPRTRKPHEQQGFPSRDDNLARGTVSIGFDRLRRFSRLYCHQNSHQGGTGAHVETLTIRGSGGFSAPGPRTTSMVSSFAAARGIFPDWPRNRRKRPVVRLRNARNEHPRPARTAVQPLPGGGASRLRRLGHTVGQRGYRTWTPLAPNGDGVLARVADPTAPETIYAGASSVEPSIRSAGTSDRPVGVISRLPCTDTRL